MRDRDLYARILNLSSPWEVVDVQLDPASEEVQVFVEARGRRRWPCPECGEECAGYDTRERRWRHLDTCQFKTFLVAAVPRVNCPEHGVRQVAVPWSAPGSSFTALFEALAIDWLREASFTAVARRLGLSWDQVDGIQGRAVRRGLRRRKKEAVLRVGVDETSFQKRHEYVTVVADIERPEPRVLFVGDHRRQETLAAFYDEIGPDACRQLEVVCMDMWEPFINATLAAVPDAMSKIAFDKFHVVRHFVAAVDQVRRNEHKALWKTGDDTLKGTRYLWVKNPADLRGQQRLDLRSLRLGTLKTARAWAIKEQARRLWSYVTPGWARKAWKQLIAWAVRSRLEPVRRAGRTARRFLWGIVNAIVLDVTNARLEALNARIQWVKKMACGYRNRQRFRNAILFHLGGLDLYPNGVRTHTIS